MKKTSVALAGAIAGIAVGAYADFDINLDLDAKPARDFRSSSCFPLVGYAGWDPTKDETYWFATNRIATAQAMRDSGAWLQRMWSSNAWFARRLPNPYDPKDPKQEKKYKSYRQTYPDVLFPFWKANGFKLLFTFEAWSKENSKREIVEFVDYIVSNKYESVVAGFELGNESYFDDRSEFLAAQWTEIVPEILKRMPEVKLGIPIAEYLENDPDLTQVRSRMLASGELKSNGYFSADKFNKRSARFVVALSNVIDKITHVIYHGYGGETPYSCSYYGFQRFRNFYEAFPELKGKKMWLSEVRLRSDEDCRCHRIFRETLIMGHWALMALAQPDMDGFNHHHFCDLSGGIYVSNGRDWKVQWRDGALTPDFRSPYDLPRLEVGSMGVMQRILAEGVKTHPLLYSHGTSVEHDTTNAFYTSARVCDQVYTRRRALVEGKVASKVDGEVEYLALTNEKASDLCLLMVNSKDKPMTATVRVKGREFSSPSYRTLSCPDEFVEMRAIPGEARLWNEKAWEDPRFSYYQTKIGIDMYKGMKPKSDVLKVTIQPHTVQSVYVMTRNVPKPKEK